MGNVITVQVVVDVRHYAISPSLAGSLIRLPRIPWTTEYLPGKNQGIQLPRLGSGRAYRHTSSFFVLPVDLQCSCKQRGNRCYRYFEDFISRFSTYFI